jgi:hypothetical protein
MTPIMRRSHHKRHPFHFRPIRDRTTMVRMAVTVLDRTPTGSIARIAAGTPPTDASWGCSPQAARELRDHLLPATVAAGDRGVVRVDAGASGLAISATTAAMLLGLLSARCPTASGGCPR